MSTEDCLQEFRAACKEVPVGEVCLADEMKYSEVISAVEIMDPRTDAMCDHESIRYFADLVHSGEIYSAEELGTLSEEATALFMQRMIALEARWIDGSNLPQTIFSTPFIHHMNFLKEHNPMLYAFCLGVLKMVLVTFDTIADADVKDSEEFLVYHFSLELLHELPFEEALLLVKAEEAKAVEKGWKTVASCFRFHTAFLQANVALSKGHANIPEAQELFQTAREEVKSMRIIPEDSVILSKLFHEMTLRWVPALTPLKAQQNVCFAEGRVYFESTIASFLDVCENFRKSIECAERMVSFVLDFSASAPSVLVRSRLLLLIHSIDAKIIEGPFFRNLVLKTLDETYGCSIFRSVVEGDEKVINDLYSMQIKRLREVSKFLPEPIDTSLHTAAHLRAKVTDFMQHLARLHIVIIFLALNNRARFRRRLANFFPELRNMQQNAWDVDTNIFGGGNGCAEHAMTRPGGWRPDMPCGQCMGAARSLVLSAYVTDVVCRMTIEFNLLGQENDLYGRNELPSAYAYNEYVVHSMVENDTVLFQAQAFEPRVKQTARLYPLLLRSRRITLPNENHTFYVEILQLFANAGLFLHTALETLGLIKPVSANSCVSAADVYALRYKSLQVTMRPSFLDYEAAQRQVAGTVGSNPLHALQTAFRVYQRVTERLQQMMPLAAPHRAARCANLLAIAKANSVTAKLLVALHQQADKWTADIQVGSVVIGKEIAAQSIIASFPVYKLKQKSVK